MEAITTYPRPINVKQIQSFFGICNYFRRYVKDFSKLSKPLTQLLKKEVPFVWTDSQQTSFESLKKALAEQVVLAFPDFNELFYVTTDASNVAIGAYLSQNYPNDRPIFFFSKTLNDTQRRYSTIERELLAIVEAIKAFRVYLYGRYFVLITDHRPLCYLFNLRDPGSRMFRQKLELMDYNFKIIYKPGSTNHVSDALSRIEKPLTINEMLEINKENNQFAQIYGTTDSRPDNIVYTINEKEGTVLSCRKYNLVFHLIPIENNHLKNKITDRFGTITFKDNFESISRNQYAQLISNQFANKINERQTQKCIEDILKICKKEIAENIALNLDYDNLRHYLYFKEIYTNIFKNTNISSTFYLNKIVELREREDIEKILDLYHKSLLGAHNGGERMYKTIRKFYTWSNMQNDIKKYVKNCQICEKIKTLTNIKVPMQISSLGEFLFDHCYIDFVGPIAPSITGSKYCFTATCDLTKFLVAVPTEDCTAITTAKCLLEHVILRYNFPSRLISDNATSFTSKVIKELTHLFTIKKIFTTPYHPQANIVERQHRTLNSYLRAFTEQNKNHWDELLKYATFVYNNTIHTTTGYTPHELAHGFKIQIPTNMTKEKPTYNYENLATIIRNTIAKSLQIAKDHLMNKKEQNKKRYDEKAKDCEIKIDDLVLIKNQNKKHKFDNVFEGPFRVTNTWDSYIEIIKNRKKMKIHKNLIKKMHSQHKDVDDTPLIRNLITSNQKTPVNIEKLDEINKILILNIYDIDFTKLK